MLDNQLKETLDAYASEIIKKQAEANDLKVEAKRLSALASSAKDEADALEEKITQTIQSHKLTKLESARFRFGFRESSAIEIENPENLPVKFTRIKFEADKAAIKKAIEAGEDVPGAALVKRQNLQMEATHA